MVIKRKSTATGGNMPGLTGAEHCPRADPCAMMNVCTHVCWSARVWVDVVTQSLAG